MQNMHRKRATENGESTGDVRSGRAMQSNTPKGGIGATICEIERRPLREVRKSPLKSGGKQMEVYKCV